MGVSVEIEVESEDKCAHCGAEMSKPAEPNKDSLLAELKKLLGESGQNNLAERQLKIDELISQISELGD